MFFHFIIRRSLSSAFILFPSFPSRDSTEMTFLYFSSSIFKIILKRFLRHSRLPLPVLLLLILQYHCWCVILINSKASSCHLQNIKVAFTFLGICFSNTIPPGISFTVIFNSLINQNISGGKIWCKNYLTQSSGHYVIQYRVTDD